MAHPFDLTGKVALVTGASTGLGQGMAIALAEAGADLGLVDRTPCDETVNLIRQSGRRAHVINADLSSLDPIDRIIGETREALGGLDALVNNAGIIKRNDSIDFTVEEWDSVMNVNLRTLFFLSQGVARAMIDTGKGGKIVNRAGLAQ